MAILGNTTINGSLNINGVPVVPAGSSPILYVTCTTPGSVATKEVEDASRVPVAGDIVIVTFTNGNSVSNPTLNINSDGAKNIRLGTTNASTTTMTVGAGSVVSLYFDGAYYNMFGSYRTSDSNFYDRMYHNVAKQMGETLYRYKLILEGIDGKFYPIVTTNQTTTFVQKTPTNATLKIGGNVLFYNATTTVAANGNVSNTYSEISTTYMVYSFNQNGSYQLQRPIYLVGIPQAGGGYKLDSNYYTQNLPTTEDGKIYIQLGIVYAQNCLRLQIEHPVYEFKDGKVRPYIAEHTHTISQITDFPTMFPTLKVGTDNYELVYLNGVNLECVNSSGELRWTDSNNYYALNNIPFILKGSSSSPYTPYDNVRVTILGNQYFASWTGSFPLRVWGASLNGSPIVWISPRYGVTNDWMALKRNGEEQLLTSMNLDIIDFWILNFTGLAWKRISGV